MDVADIADQQTETNIQECLRLSKMNRVQEKLEPTGYCQHCYEEFDEGDARLFCNNKCAEAHANQRLRTGRH